MQKSELIEEIKKVFGKTSFPKDTPIVYNQSKIALYPDFDLEESDIIKVFEGKNWWEVDIDKMIYENGALPLLSNEAFLYYLPAYMTLIIEDPGRADILWDSTVYNLTLPTEHGYYRKEEDLPKMQESFYNRMEGFSKEQKVCIRHFLEYSHNLDSKDTEMLAIENYWGKF